VNVNNVRIESFPDALVMRCLGDFHPVALLKFQSEEKADVDVKVLFAR